MPRVPEFDEPMDVVCVRLPRGLVAWLDAEARASGTDRSRWLRARLADLRESSVLSLGGGFGLKEGRLNRQEAAALTMAGTISCHHPQGRRVGPLCSDCGQMVGAVIKAR